MICDFAFSWRSSRTLRCNSLFAVVYSITLQKLRQSRRCCFVVSIAHLPSRRTHLHSLTLPATSSRCPSGGQVYARRKCRDDVTRTPALAGGARERQGDLSCPPQMQHRAFLKSGILNANRANRRISRMKFREIRAIRLFAAFALRRL
jgi:hypothetical protein